MNKFEIVTPIIVHYEGFRSKSYFDHTGNVWTIGTGFTHYVDSSPVKEAQTITEVQNNIILQNFLEHEYFPQLKGHIEVEISEAQWAALIDYSYNRGIGNVIKSGIFNLINKNPDDTVIPSLIQKTGLGGGLKGLIARRNTEAHLYSTGETKFYN